MDPWMAVAPLLSSCSHPASRHSRTLLGSPKLLLAIAAVALSIEALKMLLNFPSEILGLILNGSQFSYLILRLWKTGNRLLQEKLASGVTDVCLRTVSALPSKYPLMLSKLRFLRHLSLASHSYIFEDPRQWQVELKKLPQTLETLKISSEDAISSLLNLSPRWSRQAPLYIERRYCPTIGLTWSSPICQSKPSTLQILRPLQG